MPNRYIRESAIESERVNALSWQAEVFYRRLLNRVDDFGRYTAHADLLRAAIFPLQLSIVSGADVAKLLLECEHAGLVSTYMAGDSKQYLAIHKCEKGRALTSKYPDPPPEICERLHADANGCKQTQTNVPINDYDPDSDSDSAFKRLGKCAGSAGENGEKAAENGFILRCRGVLGKAQMAEHGGIWRTLYRQNSKKAERVIAEVETVKRDRPATIKTNLGAFAMDLWKRFK